MKDMFKFLRAFISDSDNDVGDELTALINENTPEGYEFSEIINFNLETQEMIRIIKVLVVYKKVNRK